MAENSKKPIGNIVQFSDDSDIVTVREEDTQPGTASESYRKDLKEKYGRKSVPLDGSVPGLQAT